MFTDDQLLPISALAHYVFCQRRAALVHIEGLWAENCFTAEGADLHRKAHDPGQGERRPGVRILRGLELRSYTLGLTGKADVVELHEAVLDAPPRVVLVEYKRGRSRPDRQPEYRVQLAAQALCLEEMLGRRVDQAAVYFG
jgi:CRISPR-associated exonuclease Cas4